MKRRRVGTAGDASAAPSSSTSSRSPKDRGRVDWTLWSLCLLPFLFAVSTSGYIHPDELFQNAEVAARDVFAFAGGPGAQPLRTWEWASDRPCRSTAPVWLTTGWAFALMRLFDAAPFLYGTSRLAMCFVALCVELFRDRLHQRRSAQDRVAALLLASSGAALVFIPRPFSNSLSALLLGLVLDLASTRSALAGCAAAGVAALGIWTRPDFALFAAPSGVVILGRLRRRPGAVLLAVGTFASVCSMLTVADSIYFGRGLALTPLNSVRYNLDARNLAAHGVHPRWLHAVVNVPIMFGVGGYVALWAALRRGSGESKLHLATLLVPLISLSLAPHQEPRFLLPLIHPVVRLTAVGIEAFGARARRRIWIAWLAHSLVLVALFGVAHQGGVVPALIAANARLRTPPVPAQVIIWRSYMPPRHLMTPAVADGRGVVPSADVVDLAGASATALQAAVSAQSSSLLVAPSWAIAGAQLNPCIRLQLLSRHGPHLDLDNLDEVLKHGWRSASVGVWDVDAQSCSPP